jgi:hypothetical protein
MNNESKEPTQPTASVPASGSSPRPEPMFGRAASKRASRRKSFEAIVTSETNDAAVERVMAILTSQSNPRLTPNDELGANFDLELKSKGAAQLKALAEQLTAAATRTISNATMVEQHSINIGALLYRLSLVVVLSLSVIGIIALNGGVPKPSTIFECILALVAGATIRLLFSPPDTLPHFEFSFLRSTPPTKSSDYATKAAGSKTRAAD